MIKCGFYEKDITPPLGCAIPGYFNVRLGSDVKDRLFAKAAVFANGENTVAMLVLDHVSVTAEVCAEITSRIEEYIGLAPENVMISASHSHTGGPNYPDIQEDRKGQTLDRTYLDMLCYLGADAVVLAYKHMLNMTAKYGSGLVDNISFNRNYIMKDGTVRTNPGRLNPDIVKPFAGIDPELSVLYFENEIGKPCGAIINFACHQDCVDGTEYSGDYSSIISKELKRLYGEDFVSLFILGACGNINHFDVSRKKDAPDHYVKMGRILVGEAFKVIQTSKEVDNDTVISKKEMIKIDRRLPNKEMISDAEEAIRTIKPPTEGVKLAADSPADLFRLIMAKNLIKYWYDYKNEPVVDVCVQVIKIGDCVFYCLPGEVFVQFGKYLKENSKTKRNFIVTLCNGDDAYIPIKELFLPTVYESIIGSSRLEAEAGYKICDKALSMC